MRCSGDDDNDDNDDKGGWEADVMVVEDEEDKQSRKQLQPLSRAHPDRVTPILPSI